MINPIIMLYSLTGFTTINTTQLSVISNSQENEIIKFLKNINEGNFLVNDMCETLDETYSIISGTNKPPCNYNMSYINENKIIIYGIDESIKKFFLEEKINFCKQEKIECGELTIMMKLINLLNSAVHISINTKNINDFIINLDIIEFEPLFKLYKSSLFNTELLANITVRKQKANILLTREKNRLYNEQNQNSIFNYNYFKSFFNTLNNETQKQSIDYIGMCSTNILIIFLFIGVLIK